MLPLRHPPPCSYHVHVGVGACVHTHVKVLQRNRIDRMNYFDMDDFGNDLTGRRGKEEKTHVELGCVRPCILMDIPPAAWKLTVFIPYNEMRRQVYRAQLT